jgi:hypothetical protein
VKAFDDLNEEALIDLIEGELSPAEAEALRRALEASPEAAAMVEAMARDRAVLRSTESPQPPRELLARIEPMLARPLLMEPRRSKKLDLRGRGHGRFRRQHHREQWAQRWRRRFAVAAVLLVVLGAGVWAVALLGPAAWRAGKDSLLARAGDGGAAMDAGGERRLPGSGSFKPAPTVSAEGTIHHAVPLDRLAAAAPAARGSAGSSAGSAGAQAPVIASFAVVLQGADRQRSEDRMLESLGAAGRPAALVRNFSYREAEQIEQRMLAAAGDRARDPRQYEANVRPSGTVPHGVSDERIRRLAERLRRHLAESEDTVAGSAHLYGATELAPTYEQQLTLSSRGASYTLGVRASALAQVLRRLHEQSGGSVVIADFTGDRPLTEPAGAAALKDWVRRRQAVRRFIDDLAAEGDPVVLVPVEIRE